ncbi:MAG: site-2 protease family protein [candidate division WOR-3 bacterium]
MDNRLLELVLSLPPLLLALTVHEYFHGYVAYRMGDSTPRFAGRLTFNPLKHIDIIGLIAFLIFRFGWAKPVPVNPHNFYNYKKGIIYTAIAGPLSNFLLAIVFGIILRTISFALVIKALMPVWLMIQLGVIYNLILCVFNLIPIPPLDGSKVLFYLLPAKYQNYGMHFERYGFFILIGLIFIDNLGIPILWGWIGPFVNFFGRLFSGTQAFYF